MSTALILGATSDIAVALARALAAEGYDLLLAGRRTEPMDSLAADLRVRHGVTASVRPFEAGDLDGHGAFYAGLDPQPDLVVCAFGLLGDEEAARAGDADGLRRILDANYTGAVSILGHAASALERRDAGTIVGISSVAGDRGRKSNYLYGSAKAGFSTFLAGLRHRLAGTGVHVMTVKPGFVRTKMTEGLDLPARLTATPEQVARDIVRGVRRRRRTIYSLWMWRYIMWIIRLLPEPLFLRTNL